MTQQIDLTAVELALEDEAIGIGQKQYMQRVMNSDPAEMEPGRELMRRMIPPLSAAITAFVEESLSGKPGPHAGLAKFLAMFDADDVAFITARQVLGSAHSNQRPALTACAMNLTRRLEDAARSKKLHEADPKAFKRLVTKIERTPLQGKRFVLVRKAMEKAAIARISWGDSERLRIGALLIEMCERTSGLFEIALRREGKTTVAMLEMLPETMEWLESAHNRCSLLSPRYLPMVIPPKPWTSPWHGGYLNNRDLRLKLFNARRINKNYLSEFAQESNETLYKAINAVQATPWRINERVLDVVKTLWDTGIATGGIPPADALPLPECPWGEGEAPDEKTRMDYVAARARIHEVNGRMRSRRHAFQLKLWVAEKFKDFEAIYFPHTLDWRGRLYPAPAVVNPQADDSGRALLEFANAAALGDDGAYYLAIHGANCFGIDKVPFADRVKWVEERQLEIEAVARDPLGNQWWTDAEDPFMFLAFCFEWADLMSHVAAGEPQQTFLSSIPVSWDGSCNGLQNFSAMLRDPVGGAATNLIPSETPADIYQRVADVATLMVERDAAQGEVNARYWLGKVTRKIAKRPTMTLPYGSGRYGFRDQLRAQLDAMRLEDGKPYLEGDEFLNSLYMANVMYDALGEVVVAARQAMDWLQEVAQLAAAEGLPIWWTTPVGSRVMQEYKEMADQVVNLYIDGKRLQLTIKREAGGIDKRKQAQGISPNFVHSLDAAHLMRTVCMCVDAGITSFAMVHDSYGTHAGNAGALRDMLRKSFVEQYSSNVLEKLRAEIVDQLSPARRAKVPPVPPMGGLELAGVLDSEYFFA
jgi:DNA-directed RNA polymerase